MTQLTAGNFETETGRYDSVVVMFYAGWCGKCAIMKPIVEKLEKQYGKEIKFFLVDTDKEKLLAKKYRAEIVPMFLMIRMGEIEGVMSGVIQEKTFERRMRDTFI